MKKLLLALILLTGLHPLSAQQRIYVHPNRETDLIYQDPVNRVAAGQIKVAIPGANFRVDTIGNSPVRARFLMPQHYSFLAQGAVWNTYTTRSAPPYRSLDFQGGRMTTRLRVTHPDTLVLNYGFWNWIGPSLMVYGMQLPFSGWFDMEVTDGSRTFYLDSAFNFNGLREESLVRGIQKNAEHITLHGLQGRAGQTLDVEITGKGTTFTQASPSLALYGHAPNELIVDFHNDSSFFTFNRMTVLSPTRMVANITIPAGTAPGLYDVALMTTRDGIKHINNGFRVLGGFNNTPAHLRGMLYHDANRNCRRDAGERGIPGVAIATYGDRTTVTDSLGRYDLAVPYGTFDVNRVNRIGWEPVCPPGGINQIIVNSAHTVIDSLDFGDYQQAGYDYAVSAASGFARPGFGMRYGVTVVNNGNTQGPVTVRYVPDPALEFVSANLPPARAETDTLYWNVSPEPNGKVNIEIETRLPPDVGLLGQTLASEFEILPSLPDQNPANDKVTVKNDVRGSFDPNDKSVEPSGNLTAADSILTYLIRFQNTGTDTAFTVVILDTISGGLELSSIKTLVCSHSHSFKIKDKRAAEWRFDNVRIVDSATNEERSHGFVKFTIKRNTNMRIGSRIFNQAHIYFDFNPPVSTNLVQNTIVSVRQKQADQALGSRARVVPMPVTGSAKVVLLDGLTTRDASLTITDALGRNVYHSTGLCGQELGFDARLKPGVYFLQVREKGAMVAQGRFVAD